MNFTGPGEEAAARPALIAIEQSQGAEGELFRSWNSLAEGAFDVLAASEIAKGFSGTFDVYATSRLALTRTTMPALRLVRSLRTIARTRVSHFAISSVMAGGLEGVAADRPLKTKPGDVLVFDLLQTLELESSAQTITELVTLWFPRARWQPMLGNDEATHGLVLDAGSPAGSLVGSCLRSLATEVPRMSRQDLDVLGTATIALTARAIFSALERSPKRAAPASITLNAVRRFIDQNLLSTELGIDVIAANFGLSRASLYRLFEPIGGVANYIRRQRLDRAFQEITAAQYANKHIGWIAQRHRFENVSAFTRLFRRTYGITPIAARRAALQGNSDVNADGGQASAGSWLQRLRA